MEQFFFVGYRSVRSGERIRDELARYRKNGKTARHFAGRDCYETTYRRLSSESGGRHREDRKTLPGRREGAVVFVAGLRVVDTLALSRTAKHAAVHPPARHKPETVATSLSQARSSEFSPFTEAHASHADSRLKMAHHGVSVARPPFGQVSTMARQRSRQSPLRGGLVSCCQAETVVRPAWNARWSICRISGRPITGQRFARCMLVSASPDCQPPEPVQGGFAVHDCRTVPGSVVRVNNAIARRAPTALDRSASGRLVHASCFKERPVGLKHPLEKHRIKQADTTIDLSCLRFWMMLVVLRPISPKQATPKAELHSVGRTDARRDRARGAVPGRHGVNGYRSSYEHLISDA